MKTNTPLKYCLLNVVWALLIIFACAKLYFYSIPELKKLKEKEEISMQDINNVSDPDTLKSYITIYKKTIVNLLKGSCDLLVGFVCASLGSGIMFILNAIKFGKIGMNLRDVQQGTGADSP